MSIVARWAVIGQLAAVLASHWSMFSMALSSGQLGPLIKEFGLGDEAAAAAAQVGAAVLFKLSNDLINLHFRETWKHL